MNILVIGNGFDLAHNLPTKYQDFLRFTDEFIEYKQANEEGKELSWGDNEDTRFYQYFITLFNRKKMDENAKKIIEELDDLTKDNAWLVYFKEIYCHRKETGKEGWIDFENEISYIIQMMENARHTIFEQLDQGKMGGILTQIQYNILNPLIGKTWPNDRMLNEFSEKDIEQYKNLLLSDLNKLIRCLEIYLSEYVSNLEIKKLLSEIEGLPYINNVLSFNYTCTYEKNYKKKSYANIPSTQFDYIHGKASFENTIDTNNMVLGIDEYLKGDARNENLEFIEFKKFFQRIHKETGCLYRTWIDEMKREQKHDEIYEYRPVYNEKKEIVNYTRWNVRYHNVFIYGHSLDVTDKDVISSLILADKVQTTIFYTDRMDYGRKITNLIKVIGQDELIKRTGGSEKTITFKMITK